jgi:integrase
VSDTTSAVVQQWQGLLRAQSTKELYGTALTAFCRYVNITPPKLLKKSEIEIKKLVIDYLSHLKGIAVNRAGKTTQNPTDRDPNYKISVNSIRYYMSGIKSFLDFHGKELKWKGIEKYYPEKVTNELRAYTLDELRKMLALADRRERVAILLMVSGGLRIGAIPSLKFKHIKSLENGLANVNVYAESAKDCYWALISPECVQAIEEYKRFPSRT